MSLICLNLIQELMQSVLWEVNRTQVALQHKIVSPQLAVNQEMMSLSTSFMLPKNSPTPFSPLLFLSDSFSRR